MANKKPETKPKKKESKAAPAAAPAAPSLIVKDMTLGEILTKYPDAAYIMLNHGLHCIGCHISPYETIEMGCIGHGMPEEEFKMLMAELNDLAAKKQ